MELTIKEHSTHKECIAIIKAAIDSGKNIKILNCRNTLITIIPSDGLSFLEEVYCSDCELLTEICELPSLKTLYCNNCTHLKEIHKLPALKALFCENCTQLFNIDALENSPLEILHLTNTPIQHLPILPSLYKLACNGSGIKSFESLKFSPNLHFIWCRNIHLDVNDLPDLHKLCYIEGYFISIEEYKKRILARKGLLTFALCIETDQLGELSHHGSFLPRILESYLVYKH
jgi:Leucine-rich repeat (LRR) protein